MPTLWFCDACGCELTALQAISRSFGAVNWKWLCGGCSKQMDDAALAVFAAIKAGHRPARRGLLARLREVL